MSIRHLIRSGGLVFLGADGALSQTPVSSRPSIAASASRRRPRETANSITSHGVAWSPSSRMAHQKVQSLASAVGEEWKWKWRWHTPPSRCPSFSSGSVQSSRWLGRTYRRSCRCPTTSIVSRIPTSNTRRPLAILEQGVSSIGPWRCSVSSPDGKGKKNTHAPPARPTNRQPAPP